ncbi:MAG: SDR family oxidoreductase [Deltaproteobacteria bacterium]|nr:SDR family oxidoreductase [Deltaproteobacteria bacterium]
MNLRDLHIIVTGAARGLGAHFARALTEAGATVAAGDIDEDALGELPASVHRRRLDVSDAADCDAFVAWAREAMGGLNGLINNAGIIRDGLLVRKDRETGQITRLSDEDWRSVLGVNLDGPMFMTRAVASSMVESSTAAGVVVNMASISRHGNRGQSNYVATKAALAANTVTWARELARYGIRVGAVAPGMVETPMTAGMNQKALEQFVAKIPVGRIGTPHDIWLAVKFIIECDYFTARTIDVDGGIGF